MLQWNVFLPSRNGEEISPYNIFDHSGFRRDIRKTAKTVFEHDAFVESVRRDLMYYFWTKCEYEIVICPFGSAPENTRKKVDVFTQVWNNKDAFIWYCLCNREELVSDDERPYRMRYRRLVNREDLIVDYHNDGRPVIRVSAYNYRGDLEMEETIDLPSGRGLASWENGSCTKCGALIPTANRMDYIPEGDCRFCIECGAEMRSDNE